MVRILKSVNFSKISAEEWDWFVGLFLADGSKNLEKRNYTIRFYLNPVRDTRILEKLLRIFAKLGIHPSITLKSQLNTLFIRTGCKILYKKLPTKGIKQNS